MRISVIIPVYNAEKYVINAVESALAQPEVGEVVLVEDKSPDNSLKICQDLEKEYEKVRLLRHPDGNNYGAGATRNLGIRNAKYDLIAFLDADDYYLQGRFKTVKELFEKYPDIDGVCEAIGIHFYDDAAKNRWLLSGGNELITMTERVSPNQLSEALLKGGKGWFHLNGLVVKKTIFQTCGYFFEHLKLHQDTAMFTQITEYGKLIQGRLNTPVAMQGLHNDNRFINEGHYHKTRLLLWKTLFNWAYNRELRNKILITLFRRYLYSCYRLCRENEPHLFRILSLLQEFIFESLRHPLLFVAAAVEFASNRKMSKGLK